MFRALEHLVLLWIMTDITYLLGAAQQANSSACQVKKERKKKTDRQTDRQTEIKKERNKERNK